MTEERIVTLDSAQKQQFEQVVSSLRIDSIPKECKLPAEAENAVRRLYLATGFQRPHIVWCESAFELAVMPLLLELLVQYEESVGYSRLLGELQDNIKLSDFLTVPRWKRALKHLQKYCSLDVIASLAHDPEFRHPSLQHLYEQFPWSKCGVSAAEPLWSQARKCTAEVVQSMRDSMTFPLTTRLTQDLYTQPTDQSQLIKRTLEQYFMRNEAIRLRDEPLTVFGSAQAPVVRMYERANELHSQLAGSQFEKLLKSIPAPQAEPAYRRGHRNLKGDLTLNTAGIMTFGPYHSLWGVWASFATNCYSTVAQLFPGEIEDDARYFLSDMSTFLRSGFGYAALSRVVFIWKFPVHIAVDERHQLHCEDGPAIKFRDGYGIYALQSIPVPGDLIEKPELLTTARINSETNVEVRRVLIHRYGLAKYVKDTGAGIMDMTEKGTLYLKQLPGDEALAMVQVRNSTAEPDGSFKEYFLRVPPTCTTVQEAIAWTFSMSAQEYNPDVET